MQDIKVLTQELTERLSAASSIGIMSHVEPDGDGFCASIALQHYLRARGIESEIVIDEDSHLQRFDFLMEGVRLRIFNSGLKYGLVIVLDCNSYLRINSRRELVDAAGYSMVIDHHVPENGVIQADFTFVDTTAVSVGAILFRALHHEIISLPSHFRIPIANCIYTTLLNDSNNFVNSNTDAEAFRIAAELTDCGIRPAELYRSYFLNHDAREIRYIGEVLSTIELHDGGRILYMYSTLEMQRRNNLSADAIMNVTRWVQGTRNVEVIMYLREEAPGQYKLSLRSPRLDVNSVAVSYGGGGHRSASGATLSGDLDRLKAELMGKLSQALEEHQADA
jgi:phosphoesterase RecJ-like protein